MESKPWPLDLDPEDDSPIYTWKLKNILQRRDLLQVHGVVHFGLQKNRPAFCFFLSRCWQNTPPPHPRTIYTHIENQMSQLTEQSCLRLLNILVKFSNSNPALAWFVSGSCKSPLEPACIWKTKTSILLLIAQKILKSPGHHRATTLPSPPALW